MGGIQAYSPVGVEKHTVLARAPLPRAPIRASHGLQDGVHEPVNGYLALS